ncbi:MAG: anthranilate phosphoribosyltransferase [Deltaproteobacteria bacterium]|nr:anthranilate phosphoribosyltransferase [Deltaproteobacteria bacterium]
MIQEALKKIIEKENLSELEMVGVMEEVMTGEATPAQIGAFITALRMKGETVTEITGAARVMRSKATRIKVAGDFVVDTCGTGGDNSNTFNISTCVAFVVAGAGITVAKHGNKSVSSRSGSADVLKSLGVNIEASTKVVEQSLSEIGIGFLFAPLLHGAMKFAAPVRRELGIRTIFNILGPLTNPAGAPYQVLGLYDKNLTEPLAEVLRNLGSKRAFVVHGDDGLDEITLTTSTKISELRDGAVKTYQVQPEDFGLDTCSPDDLLGGSPEDNAKIISDILGGKKGPPRDVVLLNASAAIVAAGNAESFTEGVALASEAIDSGKAMKKLEGLKIKTNAK